jgi:hypothetical protein
MEKIIKRELVIYSAILLVLIIVMHPDMISDPATRLGAMQQHENYIHPLLYTFIVYLIVFALRALVGWVIGLFRKDKGEGQEET